MSSYTKVALAVIRLVALGLVLTSFFLYASDLYLYLSHKPLPGRVTLVLKAIPLVLGLALMLKGRALAESLTKDLE